MLLTTGPVQVPGDFLETIETVDLGPWQEGGGSFSWGLLAKIMTSCCQRSWAQTLPYMAARGEALPFSSLWANCEREASAPKFNGYCMMSSS